MGCVQMNIPHAQLSKTKETLGIKSAQGQRRYAGKALHPELNETKWHSAPVSVPGNTGILTEAAWILR